MASGVYLSGDRPKRDCRQARAKARSKSPNKVIYAMHRQPSAKEYNIPAVKYNETLELLLFSVSHGGQPRLAGGHSLTCTRHANSHSR